MLTVVVYFITNKVKDAQSDLLPIAEKIFDMSGGDQSAESEKPKVILHFICINLYLAKKMHVSLLKQEIL